MSMLLCHHLQDTISVRTIYMQSPKIKHIVSKEDPLRALFVVNQLCSQVFSLHSDTYVVGNADT